MNLARPRLALLACLALAALALVRAGPPAPAGDDAPAEAFSAARARAGLAALLGDEAPHPVGSPGSAALRARLLAALRGLGLEPEEQRGLVCSEAGTCAHATNVIAWLPGQARAPALGLLSHYDSVPAGPGAADDGHGVALVLEVLRALGPGPHPAPLAAIFTDAEETGLLGARLFARHPRFGELAVVLNAEARGTTGASRMFETSDDNAALIAALAAAPRPSAQSLSYEIYRRLPNDTDLTIFKRHGVQGMNFAFIGGVQRYHTPRDDLAHLDLGSLQQQGDGVLAAARGLLASDLSQKTSHNASYVDLLGAALLRWPAWLDLPLALLALLALLVRVRRAAGAPPPGRPVRRGLLALAALALAPVLGAALGAGTLRLVEALSGPLGPWPASPHWPLLALTAAVLAACLALFRRTTRRAGPALAAHVTWIVWTLLALGLALAIPGAAILALAPALLAALHPALGALLACTLWPPLVPALGDALGLSGLFAGATVGWIATALAPLCAEEQGEKALSRSTWLLVLLALAFGLLAARAPRVDVDHPAKLSLIHLTDLDAGTAAYLADAPAGLPPEVAAAAAWGEPQAHLPWSARAYPSLAAEPLLGEGPSLTPAGPDTYLVRAAPDALAVVLQIPGDTLSGLSVGDERLDPAALRQGPANTRLVTIYAPPPEGVPLTIRRSGAAPWRLAEVRTGLPPGSPAASRPDTAVPYQWGDLRVRVRTHTWP